MMRDEAPVSVGPLFRRLFDDAAIFPPGNASMPDAVAAHTGYRERWYADTVGPLLVSVSRLPELIAVLDGTAPAEPLGVDVVVDTGLDGLPQAVEEVRADQRLLLQGLEVPLAADDLPGSADQTLAVLHGLDVPCPAYVEVPRTAGWHQALAALARGGSAVRAKFRTGGLVAAWFPTEQELAAQLYEALVLGLDLKLTAGLHGAVRRSADDGLQHHGFLNVLLAVHELAGGAAAHQAQATLALRDGAALATRARLLSETDVSALRTRFVSYGTCSVTEPVDDLVGLGLLAAVTATADVQGASP